MKVLVIDGVRYKLWTPKDEEKEFHPMIKEHSKEIFGEDSVYFDVKHKLISKSGIASIPDAYVITLSKPYQWYIVENELASHPVYSHIVPQISKFISGIENLKSQREIRDILYNEINRNKVLKAYMETKIGSMEIYRFLSELLSKPPKIVILIDEITDEVKEVQNFLKQYDTKVIEFKTYVRENAENVHAHLFEPLYAMERISERKEELRRPLPEHYKNWENMLAWVNDNVKEIVKILTNRIIEIGNVNHVAHGRYYCFYKDKVHFCSISTNQSSS